LGKGGGGGDRKCQHDDEEVRISRAVFSNILFRTFYLPIVQRNMNIENKSDNHN
jgi:hypothetical protein